MKTDENKHKTKPFDTRNSIRRAESIKREGAPIDFDNSGSSEHPNKRSSKPYAKSSPNWNLVAEGNSYSWNSGMERIEIIREGIPYASVQKISQKLGTTIKEILGLLGIPQTTYNKKRRDKALFNELESELILHLVELLDFGYDTFNHEKDKFHRWLKKPNPSLGGYKPISLLDSNTGIQEVRNCLNRIEYGNLA